MNANKKISLTGNLKNDLPASIVVFFVAVPLCLGIALASGAPLFSGLIAGIVGGIIVGVISGSPLGVSGPAAGLAVIVLNSIQSLGAFDLFLTALVLAGIIQFLLGVVRAGIIGYYFPSSVIKGMLTGIGIIIILKQIPHAFGYDKDYEGDLSFIEPSGNNTLNELSNMLNHISPTAVILSVITLFVLIFWENVLAKKHKIFTLIQGPIVVVVLGIVYNIITQGTEYAFRGKQLVSVPVSENFSGFLSQFSFPNFSGITNPEIWVTAFTIAIVASLETLLCVEATDKLDPLKRVTPTNRELYAQGIGNIFSGLIGGLPVTQVIVRSSANIQSNAQTKISAIAHGVLILLSTLFIPNILNLIPLSTLACILLIVGYKLAKPSLFKQMKKLGWEQFLPFVVTIVGIVFTDLLIGITLGCAVATFILLRNNFKNPFVLHKSESADGHIIKMKLSEEVTFLNKAMILKTLNDIPEDATVEVDLSNVISLDYDVLEILDNYKINAESKNIKFNVIARGIKQTADY
jgi:MFS superfamily sulfate permease-like transporter